MKDIISKVDIRPFPLVRIFIIIYLGLNLIGIINFPIYNDRISSNGVIYVFLLGLFGFVLGSILARGFNMGIKEKPIRRDKSKIINTAFILSNVVTLGFIIYTNVKSGQIILFSKGSRFEIFAFTNILIYVTIILTMVYYAERLLRNNKMRIFDILFLVFQAILFLSLGFRSPVISILGGMYIVFYSIKNEHQNKLKKIFSWKILLVVLVFISLMSSIAVLRVSQKYDVNKYFKNIDKSVLKNNPYLKPFIPTLALFRYDQEVVGKLIRKTQGDPMYMRLAFSNVITILPGPQEGARNIIGRLTDAPKKFDGKYWSITPTLQGAFFVDGGYFLVFFGFFLTAITMEYIRKLIIKKRNPFIFALYGLTVVALLKCIHTGYEDVSFFILIGILLVLKFLIYNINYRIKTPHNSVKDKEPA